MQGLLRAKVFDAALGRRAAYVYAVFCSLRHCSVVYIGQTLARTGALGRLAEHLSDTSGSTLRERIRSLCNVDGLDGVAVEFAAVRLTDRKPFWLEEPDYREAIESIVQQELINALCERGLGISVISRVDPNQYQRLRYVREEAERVSRLLLAWLEGISPRLTWRPERAPPGAGTPRR